MVEGGAKLVRIDLETNRVPRLSAMTEDGFLKMGPDRKLQTLMRDDRISGPNEGSIGGATGESPLRGVQDYATVRPPCRS